MKTLILSITAILTMACSTSNIASQNVTVNAINDDISYSLDLKAVASIFADSKNLEEFENRLNDYDAQISNLDLNSDGEIDFLRVVETSENNTNLVVVQAVLGKDIFQDVATIVVERDNNRKVQVQIVGDPFIYGTNYIINPIFNVTPVIFSWFWTPVYRPWISPYYYGYYPGYYRHRRPVSVNIYLSNIHVHINNHYRFNYTDKWRNPNAYKYYSNIRRDDFGVRYPDRSYNRRNTNVSNRYEMDKINNKDYILRNGSVRQNNSNSNSRDSYTPNRTSSSNERPANNSNNATTNQRPEVRKTDRSNQTISREVRSTSQSNVQNNTTRNSNVRSTSTTNQRSSSTPRSNSNTRSSSSQRNEGGRR